MTIDSLFDIYYLPNIAYVISIAAHQIQVILEKTILMRNILVLLYIRIVRI